MVTKQDGFAGAAMPNPQTAAEWASYWDGLERCPHTPPHDNEKEYLSAVAYDACLAECFDAYARQQVGAALAAHQAVIRELARASKQYIAEVQANLRAARSTTSGPPAPPRWTALQHLESWFAHPFVQQARGARAEDYGHL